MSCLLISGANRGLGLAFVKTYLADGWQVIAGCRDPQKADALLALAEQYKGELEIVQLDVTKEEDINALAKKLVGQPIDLLINNAGIVDPISYGTGAYEGGDSPDPNSYDFEFWRLAFETHVLAPARITSTFSGNLEKSKNPIVIMMGSGLASIANNQDAGRYSYRTTKAALSMLTRTMSDWLGPKDIITVQLSPGWTRTDMGGPAAPNSIEHSISGMARVIAGLTRRDNGRFLNFDGAEIPW